MTRSDDGSWSWSEEETSYLRTASVGLKELVGVSYERGFPDSWVSDLRCLVKQGQLKEEVSGGNFRNICVHASVWVCVCVHMCVHMHKCTLYEYGSVLKRGDK